MLFIFQHFYEWFFFKSLPFLVSCLRPVGIFVGFEKIVAALAKGCYAILLSSTSRQWPSCYPHFLPVLVFFLLSLLIFVGVICLDSCEALRTRTFAVHVSIEEAI